VISIAETLEGLGSNPFSTRPSDEARIRDIVLYLVLSTNFYLNCTLTRQIIIVSHLPPHSIITLASENAPLK
jgi:hypothetical protein